MNVERESFYWSNYETGYKKRKYSIGVKRKLGLRTTCSPPKQSKKINIKFITYSYVARIRIQTLTRHGYGHENMYNL